MGDIMEIARSLGLAGLGLLAAILAVKLAVQAIALVQAQQRKRNGNGASVVDCEKLRLICPMAAGNHSLDDLHEVLTQMESGIEQLNETQERIATRADTRDDRLTDVLSALRLELARKKESP